MREENEKVIKSKYWYFSIIAYFWLYDRDILIEFSYLCGQGEFKIYDIDVR